MAASKWGRGDCGLRSITPVGVWRNAVP